MSLNLYPRVIKYYLSPPPSPLSPLPFPPPPFETSLFISLPMPTRTKTEGCLHFSCGQKRRQLELRAIRGSTLHRQSPLCFASFHTISFEYHRASIRHSGRTNVLAYARICGPVSERYRSSETNHQYEYRHKGI